jgi:pyruvate,water dikinase
MTNPSFVRWFEALSLVDVPVVGGKNASLGELYRELTPQGIKVPNGFATTADAYREMMTAAGAWDRLHELLDCLDKTDAGALRQAAAEAREIVYRAANHEALQREILNAYHRLVGEQGSESGVAVRSSATAEDLPTASFAGQHETFLNVHGDAMLLEACRRCFASLFTDRAISYRIDKGFDHFKVALSIGIMKMVRSDLAASGVMFSVDTESGFDGVVFITGAYGLGETVVQGSVDPDEFYVHKPTFAQGYRAVLRRELGEKQIKMIYSGGGMRETSRTVPTPQSDRERYCISDDEVLALTECAMKIEDHYSRKAGRPTAMDIEWAKDGIDGAIYIVQARPETVVSQRRGRVMRDYRLTGAGKILATGRAVGRAIASGPARVVRDAHHLEVVQPGDVLVAETTTPDWEPVMKRAAAIVTDRGGRTCHAAIIARELGIPAVVGARRATEVLGHGGTVTVSCAEGDVGKVYDGEVPFEATEVDLGRLERPATHIMVNLGNPGLAFALHELPTDGVGLARMEFIIAETIKAHPMALVHPERVSDPRDRAMIERLARHRSSPAQYFVETLSEGIATIAAAMYPKTVIVRMSDFKTNEYASLVGGRDFEPVEANPMIGFRGAARYAHPAYAEGFALECAAMKRVRDVMGFANVKLMIPFCRRVEEARRVLDAMAASGLRRGENGLEIYMMCEIPNNVLRIDAFAELFDGFSIGSNDLTQLALGVDRDSDLVSFDYDERDPGVLELLRLAVTGARRNARHVSICGQAPSDYPEIARMLVELGIDSLSLNPDAVLHTTVAVLEIERALGRPPRPSTGASAVQDNSGSQQNRAGQHCGPRGTQERATSH